MAITTFVQISDLHVTRAGEGTDYSADPGIPLGRCLADISRLDPPPAALVASGDLTNDGTAEQYARLRSQLAGVNMPVYLLPGNHDRRDELRRAFGEHRYLPGSGPLSYAFACGALHVIALDTLVEGEEGGRLDARQIAWLDDTLARGAGMPTVIVLHHPPFPTGIPRMDEIALDADSARGLGDVVGRHPHVQRMLCGHVHREVHARWRGVPVSLCPSTAFQTELRFTAAPFAADTSQPSGYFVHLWNGAELVTHTVNVTGI